MFLHFAGFQFIGGLSIRTIGVEKLLIMRYVHVPFVIVFLLLVTLGGCKKEMYDSPEMEQLPEVDTGGGYDTVGIDFDTVEMKELLLNGGLEKWVDRIIINYDIPEYWFCHNNHNVTKENSMVWEGRYSARMSSTETGSTARIDQRVAVTPGHRIRIRFRYRVEQWKSKGARTYCYFRTNAAETYNIPVDELKAFYSPEEYYIIRGGGYGLTYLPHDLNVWKVFDEIVTVPPTAYYFVFGVNSYYGTTLYVDDCSVMEFME